MLEVIYAGSLFLSVNPFLQNNSPDLALIHTSQSTLVQPDVRQPEKSPGLYLAETEAEAEYRRNLEQLMDRFNIIIQDPKVNSEDSSDNDAEQRRRELEAEYQSTDGDETEDSGDEHTSKYSQEAEDARNGDFSSSDDNSDEDEDSSDDDAAERRQELGF